MRARALLLLAGAAFLALSAPAFAETHDPWAGVEVMADQEMAEARGGLAISPGILVGFGATITTLSDGVPVLRTTLSWTDAGPAISQTVGALGVELSRLTTDEREALGLGAFDLANGVVLADSDGVTTLVHNVSDGALQNIIFNTANGRDLEQRIDVTLTLDSFDAVQNAIILERIGLRLHADLEGVTF